jgi:hypothetical protein
MNHHRLITCLIAGLTVAAAPLCASAQQYTTKKYAEVGGWIIEANIADGQHMNCGGTAPGGGKISFENSSEGWTVVVPTAAKGNPGDEAKGAVEIDGKATKGPFYRRDDGRVMSFLKPPQIKQLRTAKAMVVSVGQEKTPVPLAGIDAALRKAAECNDKGGA